MASAEKGSSRSAGRPSSSRKSGSGKPSGAKSLHDSARKQTTAVARGGAGQKAMGAKKTSSASAATGSGKKSSTSPKKKSPLKAVGNAVRSAARKVTSALKPKASKASTPSTASPRRSPPDRKTGEKPRTVRRTSDVDPGKLDEVSGQVSSKGPFDARRSDALRQQDIDSAVTNRNDRWADEDHLTNKSGDKRIGTKNRTYE